MHFYQRITVILTHFFQTNNHHFNALFPMNIIHFNAFFQANMSKANLKYTKKGPVHLDKSLYLYQSDDYSSTAPDFVIAPPKTLHRIIFRWVYVVSWAWS